VVVDVGASFHSATLKYLPRHGITHIDAFLISHEHFDATGGIPFLRVWKDIQPSIKLYTCQATADDLQSSMPWAFNKQDQTAVGPGVDLHVLPDRGSFQLFDGLTIETLQVEHGKRRGAPFLCTAFLFPLNILHMSDVSHLTDGDYTLIKTLQGDSPLSVALIDGYGHPKPTTHFSLAQSLECAKRLEAQKCYLTQVRGAFCPESSIDSRIKDPRRLQSSTARGQEQAARHSYL
jgi:phosphoribosyl 1,2-cyclic phosphate phosphodiesterase